MNAYAVRADSLAKTYRIRNPDAPRLRDYASRPWHAVGRSRTIDVHALSDVSFGVEEGEVFGIIGRNGAGKSTLLKILSRITIPTAGRVTIAGRVASLLEVGTGFHPELTGRENIFLNGMLLGMSSRDVSRVFDEICAFAGVDAYIDTPIKRYSSGMQLRLAFAVAAHLAADTMIVDEVLAVGDAEFQAKCTTAMRDASGRGRTTLFVSHNMAAVENLCTRVLWLERGQVQLAGSPAEVIGAYLRGTSDMGGLDYVAATRAERDAPVRIARASVRGPADGAPVQGEDILLTLELAVRERVRRLQLLVWIASDGGPVCALSNADYRAEWNVEPGAYQVRVNLPGARLLPRRYSISMQLMLDWGRELFDDVHDALAFSPSARDVLGTGIVLLANRGVTWLPADFTITQLTSRDSE